MKLLAFGFGIVIAAAGLTACDTTDPVGGACGDGFIAASGTVGDFGTGEAALKVEAFLHAAADLYGASVDLEGDVLGACTAMATDLGIPASELEPGTGELAVTVACGRVADEIDAIVASLPSGIALGISATPASCAVDLDLAATCAADCDVTIDGTATVECSGELHGSCSGSCSGSCTVDGTVSCTGACSGSCSGSCSGTCHGTCTGTCSANDAQGNCAGTCTGTCEGACDAECSGTCTGSCTADVTGSCTGECSGGCDASWDAQCTGEADVTANADCKAACDAQANATATCTLPDVTIVGVEVGDPTAQARVDALVATLETNFPVLLQAQARIQYALAPSLQGFVSSIGGAATSLADAGLQAAACLGVAADAVSEAAATIDASVSVTVEVSAS
ncbi:MAG: hypothetical protein KC464_06860, partial [Myxococcales bacterium]|nr:hypothetical protein [Myxococcales bacterium]